ncbi:hypothetical protein C7212DRAFT_366839 [Tuber magnatum]|uniref:Uncharacterized protein n=1 Tax=Tuber magnatum TaxID=42249 RepID=A0A317SFX2_9PEZI|nr:hypothetical protein C7212DRAFT_366839 [Tuber magnatum]
MMQARFGFVTVLAIAIGFLIGALCGDAVTLASIRRAILQMPTPTSIPTPNPGTPTYAVPGPAAIVIVHLVILAIAEYALVLVIRARFGFVTVLAIAIGFLIGASCGYSITLASIIRCAISQMPTPTSMPTPNPGTPTYAVPAPAAIVIAHLVILAIAEYALILVIRIGTWYAKYMYIESLPRARTSSGLVRPPEPLSDFGHSIYAAHGAVKAPRHPPPPALPKALGGPPSLQYYPRIRITQCHLRATTPPQARPPPPTQGATVPPFLPEYATKLRRNQAICRRRTLCIDVSGISTVLPTKVYKPENGVSLEIIRTKKASENDSPLETKKRPFHLNPPDTPSTINTHSPGLKTWFTPYAIGPFLVFPGPGDGHQFRLCSYSAISWFMPPLVPPVENCILDSRYTGHLTLDEGHGPQHCPDHWGPQTPPTQGPAISNDETQGRPPAALVIMLHLRFQRVNTVGITHPLWESRIQTALIVSAFVTLSCTISVDLSLCPTWIRYI